MYDRLAEGNVCTFSTTSLETVDQNVTEIQRVITELKPPTHFVETIILTQYIFYWWENVQSILTIDNSKDEFVQFKKWFTELINTDCDRNGMAWDEYSHFIAEWEELTEEYSFSEMWDLLEKENLT